jgi:Holliday junction resolvasome RuvABC endonuclease subunit
MENHTLMPTKTKKEKEKTEIELTKYNILGLDVAQHCGYFSQQGRGTWDFTEGKKRNDNKQHKAFRDTLISFIRENNIKQIVAEDVNVNNYFTDMRKLCEFRGILKEICDELDMPEPEFVNVATLKKWATGDGHAKKDKMIDMMIRRYGLTPCDDNEADACHLYHYYCRKHHLN